MLVRISCDRPAALWTDGRYLGAAAGEPRYADLGEITELRPLSRGDVAALPLCAPTSALTAGEGAETVLYGDLSDVFVRLPVLPPRGTAVLFQSTLSFSGRTALVTAFRDGGDKITVDGAGLFGVFDLPAGLSDFHAEARFLGTAPCVSLSARRAGKRYLFVYDLAENRLLYRGRADAERFGETLSVTRKSADLARHTVTEEWARGIGGLTLASYRSDRDPAFSFVGLRDFAKPYALAEEVLAGGNPADFLCPELREQWAHVAEYLGSFRAVLPPPARSGRSGAALVPAGSPARARFLTVELEGGLISNLRAEV